MYKILYKCLYFIYLTQLNGLLVSIETDRDKVGCITHTDY